MNNRVMNSSGGTSEGRGQRLAQQRKRQQTTMKTSHTLIIADGISTRQAGRCIIEVARGRLWKRFAKDFLDEDITNEYNSIKHGLRVSMGGFSMAIGLETTPGVLAPPDAMRSLGGSAYGTSFPVVRQLNDKDNFQAIRQSMNWRPENLAYGLNLVSMSIHNIVRYLKKINGIGNQDATFRHPRDEADFDAPWRLSTGIERFNMDHVIDENSISTFSKAEIKLLLEADQN